MSQSPTLRWQAQSQGCTLSRHSTELGHDREPLGPMEPPAPCHMQRTEADRREEALSMLEDTCLA